MSQEDNNLEVILETINSKLDAGRELISEDSIVDFKMSSQNISKQLEEIKKTGRVLKLGIVGQVKAGKSSFLNAMLFEGKSILPKAPTPMTAALTRISYSEHPSARIVFYENYDWNGIVSMANKYDEELDRLYSDYCSQYEKNKDSIIKKHKESIVEKKSKKDFEKLNKNRISSEYISCKEVVDMAKNLNVNEYLGTEVNIDQKESNLDYLEKLNEFVGTGGKFTPIVKYTEIQLNNELLKGVEVIDTPGLNDPILSRSRTTQKFLIECDVVFLLGYCGQFLGAEDIEFITSSLPNEGINKAVLIGSKLDSAILQYAKRNATFKEAYLKTIKNCSELAEQNINSCMQNRTTNVIKQIKESLPPKYISSLAYSAAMKKTNNNSLDEAETNMIDNMKKRFLDFKDSTDLLFGLSNIIDVRDKVFMETKAQKEKIISERISEITKSQVAKFLSLIGNIDNQVRANQSDLKKYDYSELDSKLNSLKDKLDSTRVVIRNLFEKSSIEVARTVADIAVEIYSESVNHNNLEVAIDTETKHHSSTSGHLFWKHTDHWDEVIKNNTAEVNDVSKKIKAFYINSSKIINSNFRNLIKIEELKDKVKETVLNVFDKADKEFDENRILIPLDNALNKIIIPNIELDITKYDNILIEKLSGIAVNGIVKNENIPLLKKAQDDILTKMSQDLVKIVKNQGKEMEDKLLHQSSVFIDDIVNQLEDNMKKLEAMIKDKKINLKKFDDFISTLDNAKKLLLKLGGN